uniref:Uncharacterized protein n=1 Tax=viral metagenome TaxID=1070528 RepID=A0A6C0DG61_9ZZZZ
MSPTDNIKRTDNGIFYKKNGWNYVSLKGTPSEVGYAHGFLLAAEYKKALDVTKFTTLYDTGYNWDFFVESSKKLYNETIKDKFPDLYEEMEGMAKGCSAAGVETTVDEIIAWNNSISLLGYWLPHSDEMKEKGSSGGLEGGSSQDRCSAFIAVGDYTEGGKIVVAHNSFTNFTDGQFENCVVDIHPNKGHRIIMQSPPCYIWSATDFFITSKGIIGTETTIGGFIPFENKYPISCRIRKAMNEGNTLDDYVKILWEGNSGDYANSWLFGDTNTNEIMRLELGLKYKSVERTKNGVFIGFNAPYDPQIRNLECSNTGMDDVRRHQGARKVRLGDLMEEYKGKLNAELAMKIIGDHYDVYLGKENPCSRTICSHYDLDGREYMSEPGRPKPFQARGAVDGCVSDTDMIKQMSFMGRFGNSCGTPFIVDEYINKNRVWAHLKPYLFDRPTQPWTLFSSTGMKKNSGKKMKTIKKSSTKRSNKTSRKNTPHPIVMKETVVMENEPLSVEQP